MVIASLQCMNKTYFDFENLLDVYVRNFKSAGQLQAIGSMVEPQLSGISHGSSEEIIYTLNKVVRLYSKYSKGLFIGVNQFEENICVKFTLKFYLDVSDLPNEIASKRIDSLLDYSVTSDGITLSYIMPVEILKFRVTPKRKLNITVVSTKSYKSLILQDQLKLLGHNCDIISNSNLPSGTFNCADMVLIDEVHNIEQHVDEKGPCFIGIGANSTFENKIEYPVFITDLLENIQAEANMRVLIVDDSPSSLQTTSLILQNLGYETKCVETAIEALKELEFNEFEILLTDIHLDDMSGLELIRKIKLADFKVEHIFVMTGSLEKDLHNKAFEVGADQVLIKPIRKKQLTNVLNFSDAKIIK